MVGNWENFCSFQFHKWIWINSRWQLCTLQTWLLSTAYSLLVLDAAGNVLLRCDPIFTIYWWHSCIDLHRRQQESSWGQFPNPSDLYVYSWWPQTIWWHPITVNQLCILAYLQNSLWLLQATWQSVTRWAEELN